MLLSVEVIIGQLSFTKIIGVCCERRAKSINRNYSNIQFLILKLAEYEYAAIIVVCVVYIGIMCIIN